MREPMDDGDSGDAQVDEAVRTLESLEQLPVHEHAQVVERVHQVLLDRLAGEPDALPDDDLDTPPGAARTVPAGPTPGVTPGPTPAGPTRVPAPGSTSGGSVPGFTPGATPGPAPRPAPAGPTPGSWSDGGAANQAGDGDGDHDDEG